MTPTLLLLLLSVACLCFASESEDGVRWSAEGSKAYISFPDALWDFVVGNISFRELWQSVLYNAADVSALQETLNQSDDDLSSALERLVAAQKAFLDIQLETQRLHGILDAVVEAERTTTTTTTAPITFKYAHEALRVTPFAYFPFDTSVVVYDDSY